MISGMPRAGQSVYNPHMSGNRFRALVLLCLAAALLGVATWWGAPRLVAALPGRIRQYIPEPVAERIALPLPAALPAPAGPAPGAVSLALGTPETAAMPTDDPPAAGTPAAEDEPLPVETPVPTAGSTAATTATPAPSPLPESVRLSGLEIIPQKFNNCGPANLSIVLNSYGVAADQLEIAGVIRPNYEDRNVSPDELVNYVRSETSLRAKAFAGGDLDTLRRLLAAGFPVIIEKGLEPGESIGWMGHYLTVYGYDDSLRQLLVRDTYLGPWEGDGVAGYDETERYWAQFNGTFVVAYPPERAAELNALLSPRMAPFDMWTAAVEASRDSIRRSPEDAFAWFNLGTNLTALGKLTGERGSFEAAAAAYDQARLYGLPPRMLWYQFGPYEAYLEAGRPSDVLALAEATLATQGGRSLEETYYYQGRALMMAGNAPAARAALARAVELNPDSAIGLAARDLLQDG